MDLTPANLNAMFTNFSLLYGEGYKGTEPWWRKLATLIPSKSETNTYGWMDKIPKLRKWVGQRVVQNVAARSQILTNETFELTESVPKEKIADDQYGLYAPLAQQMGQQAAKWPDQLIASVMGENPVCFDGKTFFASDHPVNMDDASFGTYDNDLALALTATNYGTARATLRGFKGADGQPIGARGSLLVVPPSLEETALQILNNDFLPGFVQGSSAAGNVGNMPNVWKGSADLLVIDELESDPTEWYLLDNTNVIKPFVFQLREAPQFAYLNRPTDPNVFWNRAFVFGVEARGVAHVSLPFLAIRSKP